MWGRVADLRQTFCGLPTLSLMSLPPELSTRQIFTFAISTTRQCDNYMLEYLWPTKSQTFKISGSKWSSHNEYSHNAISNNCMASKHGRDVATVMSRAQLCLSTWLQHVGWENKDDDDCDAAHVAHADPFPLSFYLTVARGLREQRRWWLWCCTCSSRWSVSGPGCRWRERPSSPSFYRKKHFWNKFQFMECVLRASISIFSWFDTIKAIKKHAKIVSNSVLISPRNSNI